MFVSRNVVKYRMEYMVSVLIWVFNLLYQVRFSRPLTQVITRRYGQSTLRKFRHLQKLQLQRDKSTCDLVFLRKCKSSGIFPKFIHFKSGIKNFSNSKLYLSFLHKCLNYEINNKERGNEIDLIRSLMVIYLNSGLLLLGWIIKCY